MLFNKLGYFVINEAFFCLFVCLTGKKRQEGKTRTERKRDLKVSCSSS